MMSDLIRKKDAVSAISDLLMILDGKTPTWNEVYHAINDIPSVESERKTGKWLDIDAVISLEDGIMKEHFDNKEKDPNAFRPFATALALKIFLLKTYANQNHDVLRGEWVTNKDGEEICSVCWTPKKASELHGKCVYCGAEMRGE